ncbi:hypothetical protein ACFZC7_40185 [Streptomyces massasporeus]|uniref:hypothetical protein n=1 Tax=Streptomyces massasporeus TaxID=67324 RepID=UPI0036E6545A
MRVHTLLPALAALAVTGGGFGAAAPAAAAPAPVAAAVSVVQPAVGHDVHRVAPAGATEAVPAEGSPRAACLVITAQGGGHPTIFNRWADVRNDCGRHIDRVTVQLDYHVDPACQALAPGKSARYHWISTLQENIEANYAYECPGP